MTKIKILLADESPTINKVFDVALKNLGAEIKTVQHGIDVLEVAESFKPDIIFSEILLSKMNGYEVCSQIKQNSDLNKIPVVLMWSGFMDIDEDKFITCQADSKLEKPFSGDLLIKTIQKNLPNESKASKLVEDYTHSSSHVIANPLTASQGEPPTNETGVPKTRSSQDLFGVLAEGLELSKITNLENSNIINTPQKEVSQPSNTDPSHFNKPSASSLNPSQGNSTETSNSTEATPLPQHQQQSQSTIPHPAPPQNETPKIPPASPQTSPQSHQNLESENSPPPPPPENQAPQKDSNISSANTNNEYLQPQNPAPFPPTEVEFYTPETSTVSPPPPQNPAAKPSEEDNLNLDSFQNLNLNETHLPLETPVGSPPPSSSIPQGEFLDPSEEITVIPSQEEEQALLNKIREDAQLRQANVSQATPSPQSSYSGELGLNQNITVHRNVEDSFHPPHTPPQTAVVTTPTPASISLNNPNVTKPPIGSENTTHSLVENQAREMIQSLVWELVPELAKQIIEKEIKRLLAEEDPNAEKS